MARGLVYSWLACGVVACGALGVLRTAAAEPTTPARSAMRAAPADLGANAAPVDTGEGRVTWLRDCAVCHGPDARGGQGGPDITDRGAASIDFMVTTGRMPLPSPSAPLQRRPSPYDAREQRALVEYAATLVNGPAIPEVTTRGVDVARGGQLYRERCASCHQAAGGGGAIAKGADAPDLSAATPVQVVEALRIGPGAMPTFPDASISEAEADQIAAYVEVLQDPADPGGIDLGRLGPVPEGLIAWVFGLGTIIVITRLLGQRRSGG